MCKMPKSVSNPSPPAIDRSHLAGSRSGRNGGRQHALIARLAGVSNGIISHYFQDKNGLIAATMRYLMSVSARTSPRAPLALEDNRPRAHLSDYRRQLRRQPINWPGNENLAAFWPPACITRLCTGCSGSTITVCIPTCAASSAECCRLTMHRSAARGLQP